MCGNTFYFVDVTQSKPHEVTYRAFPLGRSVSPDKLVYVGVHNRRTDHLHYQAEGGWLTLQPGYFLESLEVYRQWFAQSGKHLIFLFVSDDLDWARQKLLPRIKTKGGRERMETAY